MNNMERMKGYAMGQVVDRIPFSVAGGDTYASIYGYTQKQYRESLDVQFDVAERAKKIFVVVECMRIPGWDFVE